MDWVKDENEGGESGAKGAGMRWSTTVRIGTGIKDGLEKMSADGE